MYMLKELEQSLGTKIESERARLLTLGLNHLTWYRGFTVDGEDVWPRLLEQYIAQLKQDPDPEWIPRLIESLRMLPNGYLEYFYQTDRKLAAQEKWPPSRGEQVIEIEKSLLRQYADPALTEPPADLMKRGGAYYSTLATQLIDSHYNDLGQEHVVNTRQDGVVPGWPADWVLELPCRVRRSTLTHPSGIEPLPAEPLPPVCFGLLAQVKSYELLTVEAAVHGDRNAAYHALLANPLGPKAGQAQAVLEDMLETNRPYLPKFWS
jgi:6-phospho-beta-glucosidase